MSAAKKKPDARPTRMISGARLARLRSGRAVLRVNGRAVTWPLHLPPEYREVNALGAVLARGFREGA